MQGRKEGWGEKSTGEASPQGESRWKTKQRRELDKPGPKRGQAEGQTEEGITREHLCFEF